MPTFVTIGYGDREGYDRTIPAIRDAALAHDAKLQNDGTVMGIAGSPIQVRNHGALRVEVTQGPFMSSGLPIAGFALIEAANVEDAVKIASQAPCAVAYGVVEIWPLEQPR